jgi:UPF0331 protein MA_1296
MNREEEKSLRIADCLEQMLESIRRIEKYTEDMYREEFLSDQLVQDGVLMQFCVLGEVSKNVMRVDSEFAEENAHVPWAAMYEFRNRISHGFHAVDMEMVWEVATVELEGVHDAIGELRASLSISISSRDESTYDMGW